MKDLEHCSEVCRVLEIESSTDSLQEGLVDVVILPVLGRCLALSLETHVLRLLLQILTSDSLEITAQISLRSNKNDWCVGADLANLGTPFHDVLERRAVVKSDTNHEAVSLVVADLAIYAEMSVTTRVVDL